MLNLNNNNLYNIADIKTKNIVNTYIEEWKDKGLLTGYFGMLANNIYKKNRVKNSVILELLIYGTYIEEQNKLKPQSRGQKAYLPYFLKPTNTTDRFHRQKHQSLQKPQSESKTFLPPPVGSADNGQWLSRLRCR